MLTVLDIANAAVAESQDDLEGSNLTVSTILALLDVVGSVNMHLANPLNHSRRGGIRRRETALSGNEPVYGAFLTLAYSAHDPLVLLSEHTNIQKLEEFLASNSGPTNRFVTCCTSFIEGKLEPYRIGYIAADGAVGFFDKHFQNIQGHHSAEKAVERWVVWSSDALVSHGRWPTPEWSR